jgi:hypothetical protein
MKFKFLRAVNPQDAYLRVKHVNQQVSIDATSDAGYIKINSLGAKVATHAEC